MNAPTQSQSEAIQRAYDYFNTALFDGELPECMLNFSRYGRRTMGFFIAATWEERTPEGAPRQLHEISLCPTWINRDVKEVMITLVREMVNLWQQEYGKPSRRGYHNKEWARKMVNIGLFPSDTGQPGGKMTGQSMSHYVLPNAPFDIAFNCMPEENLLPFVCSNAFTPPKITIEDEEDVLAVARLTRRKVKYTCHGCQANAWGKPGLHLNCGMCNCRMYVQVG